MVASIAHTMQKQETKQNLAPWGSLCSQKGGVPGETQVRPTEAALALPWARRVSVCPRLRTFTAAGTLAQLPHMRLLVISRLG